jgi:hypothetical protein
MAEPTVVKSDREWRERRRIRTFGPARKARFAGPVVTKSWTCLAEASVIRELP